MSETLKPCPFCGGECEISQTGQYELTLRCVGVQPSGLRGCGPKYVQKVLKGRHTLEWLADVMTAKWNTRAFEASQARIASLEEALGDMLQAVCGETGFANAVRQVSGLAYPWPALDDAEAKARAALLAAGGRTDG